MGERAGMNIKRRVRVDVGMRYEIRDRARNRCEACGRPLAGLRHLPGKPQFPLRIPAPAEYPYPGEYRYSFQEPDGTWFDQLWWGHIHHRDENPGNNAPENLQLLCVRCHAKAHGAGRPRP